MNNASKMLLTPRHGATFVAAAAAAVSDHSDVSSYRYMLQTAAHCVFTEKKSKIMCFILNNFSSNFFPSSFDTSAFKQLTPPNLPR